MKRFLLALAVVACLSAPVAGQDLKPFSLYLGLGVSLPSGDFSNAYKLGLHGSAGIGFKLAPGFQIAPKVEFHTFSIDEEFWQSSLGASSVDGGTLNGILAGADLRFGPPLPAVPVKPFFFGGAGFARLSVADLDYDAGLLPATESFDAENKFYWNLGAGMEFGSSPVMSFFIQARYLSIATDAIDYNMIPVTAGIKF